jgi:aryl-alcohol dehydrogenase-like predicted oxidoreductase
VDTGSCLPGRVTRQENQHVQTRPIGSLSVTVAGLGCNNFARKIDREASVAVVHAALDAGINFFDTADRYGYGDRSYSGEGLSETLLGEGLGSRRSEVIVSTKFGNPLDSDPELHRGGSRRWVVQACENSLRRLGTGYIDIYHMHSPDPDTPIEETLEALTDLVEAGKVRELGCSGFSADQLGAAMKASLEHGFRRFESVMHDYSLIHREPESELIPAVVNHGASFLPYFPLASGLLTGKYRKGQAVPAGSRMAFWTPRPHFALSDENLDRIDRLNEYATSRGHSLLELAHSWLLAKPVVASVIAGATSPEQVKANANSVGWVLSARELAEVDQL